MSKPIQVLVLTLLVVVALVGLRLALAGPVDERAEVREALRVALKASREGKPGGLLDHLSASLKVNDTDMQLNGKQIGDFIADQKPDITVDDPEPVVTGNEARIKSSIRLKMGLFGVNVEKQIKSVTMIFRRESARVFLVFPSQKWRLTDVQMDDADLNELMPN